jgi:hypothetical protein
MHPSIFSGNQAEKLEIRNKNYFENCIRAKKKKTEIIEPNLSNAGTEVLSILAVETLGDLQSTSRGLDPGVKM